MVCARWPGAWNARRRWPLSKSGHRSRSDARGGWARESNEATTDIWIFDAPRWTANRLTAPPNDDDYPVWSPDGARLTFGSRVVFGGGMNLRLQHREASTPPATVYTVPFTLMPRAWAASGALLFDILDRRGLLGLWITAPDGRREPTAFKTDAFDYTHAAISPNGRWVAYVSNLSGRFELYVERFPETGARRLVPRSAGAREPRWRKDGRELYFLSAEGLLTAVQVSPGNEIEFGEPQSLFRLPLPSRIEFHSTHYDVGRDGSFLATAVTGSGSPAPEPVTVSLNASAAPARGAP
jgi:Tol biopolymer transport system component